MRPVAISVGALVNICAPVKPIVPPPEVKVKSAGCGNIGGGSLAYRARAGGIQCYGRAEILALTAIEPLVPACNVNAPVAVMLSE